MLRKNIKNQIVIITDSDELMKIIKILDELTFPNRLNYYTDGTYSLPTLIYIDFKRMEVIHQNISDGLSNIDSVYEFISRGEGLPIINVTDFYNKILRKNKDLLFLRPYFKEVQLYDDQLV